MPYLDEFQPENLPSSTTPTVSGGFGAAAFIPTIGAPQLTTDLTTAEGVGVWSGYIQAPPAFTKTASSGLVAFTANSDIGTILLGSDSIINHDIVITYKLTDSGSDTTVNTLPAGGTTIQIAVVNDLDVIYKTPASDPPQIDVLTLRKFTNGVHDTVILKSRIQHSNNDKVRIKFWGVNGNGVDGVRINCFSINWQMSVA
jgi:hypothetical protein